MMIFLSLRVTADAEGGLKDRRKCAGPYGGLGASATNKRASVYTGALLAATYSTALTISLSFIFNQGNKFAWAHIKCICNFPQSFKICLLVTILNHRQMSAGNSRKTAQDILRYASFVAKIAYCPSNRTIVELHRHTPLSQLIVYEKTRK